MAQGWTQPLLDVVNSRVAVDMALTQFVPVIERCWVLRKSTHQLGIGVAVGDSHTHS